MKSITWGITVDYDPNFAYEKGQGVLTQSSSFTKVKGINIKAAQWINCRLDTPLPKRVGNPANITCT